MLTNTFSFKISLYDIMFTISVELPFDYYTFKGINYLKQWIIDNHCQKPIEMKVFLMGSEITDKLPEDTYERLYELLMEILEDDISDKTYLVGVS